MGGEHMSTNEPKQSDEEHLREVIERCRQRQQEIDDQREEHGGCFDEILNRWIPCDGRTTDL